MALNITSAFANFTYPGVRLVESTAGYRVIELASHITSYVFGTGTLTDIAINTPTLVSSLTDFQNQFGASSPSEDSVQMYFENHRSGTFYFIRVGISPIVTVVVDTASEKDYSVDVQGVTVTYSASALDSVNDIASGILANINSNSTISPGVLAYAGATENEFIIRVNNPEDTLTVANIDSDLTGTPSTPTNASFQDFIFAIQNTFDPDEGWNQGFVFAPEAFQTLPSASERLSVGNALTALASAEGFDWVALIDGYEPVDSAPTIAEVNTDGVQYTSSLGHVAYYAPYLINLLDQKVPPSAAIAAAGSRKYEQLGFQEPIGGTRYALLNVKDVSVRFSNTQQGTVNSLGINLIRNLRNKGVVIWGMRTRSSDVNYRFLHTRVIMNVLNGTLRGGFDNYPFSSIDGNGNLLHRIGETAVSVCRRMYRGGALFGQEEDQAFQVVCDFTNNPADFLELGQVILEVYVAPAPGLEKLLINTIRVPIGQVQSAVDAAQTFAASIN